jgi:hypothetical protein
MPMVNIYYKVDDQKQALIRLIPELKTYIAKQLTCGDIKLSLNEITIRLVDVEGDGMIGAVEVDISAHAFPERIKRQDEICRNVMNYIKQKATSVGDVKVWLKLCELGHSW